LAVSNRWKSREGEMNESTEWVNIEVWDRLGEVCQEFLKKGSLVYLEGRLKTDKYEENGESRFFTKVVASTIEFLDGKSADDPMVRKQDEIEDEVVEYQL
jgi:single-strand DNA-binding protein